MNENVEDIPSTSLRMVEDGHVHWLSDEVRHLEN